MPNEVGNEEISSDEVSNNATEAGPNPSAHPEVKDWEIREGVVEGEQRHYAIFEDGDRVWIGEDDILVAESKASRDGLAAVALSVVDRLRILNGGEGQVFSLEDLRAVVLEAERSKFEQVAALIESELGAPLVRTRAAQQEQYDRGEPLLDLNQAILEIRERQA